MGARYFVVDVFAPEPFTGNALAVFPDPRSVAPGLMQRVAREMNLSESAFVTAVRDDGAGYEVRIFTPYEEMPFAGHPTLGTAWVLRRLGAIQSDSVVQRTTAGQTLVTFEGDLPRFERSGVVSADVDAEQIARALGIPRDAIGFDASAIGAGPASLRPARANAGLEQLMVPLRDPELLARVFLEPDVGQERADGMYCVAPLGAGRVKARFLTPGSTEDPATGSAAAGLGLYISNRAGPVTLEIHQGAEVARPSVLLVWAADGKVRVGGAVRSAAEGTLLA